MVALRNHSRKYIANGNIVSDTTRFENSASHTIRDTIKMEISTANIL